MHTTAALFPREKFLRGETNGDHEQLQEKPLRREPEKQIDAKDDRNRPEPEHVGVAPRQRQQHVEGIAEQQLRRDERCLVVHRTPVPAPIEQHRGLRARLKVVLLPKHDVDP